MPWLFKLPGHQQEEYWLCGIDNVLSWGKKSPLWFAFYNTDLCLLERLWFIKIQPNNICPVNIDSGYSLVPSSNKPMLTKIYDILRELTWPRNSAAGDVPMSFIEKPIFVTLSISRPISKYTSAYMYESLTLHELQHLENAWLFAKIFRGTLIISFL